MMKASHITARGWSIIKRPLLWTAMVSLEEKLQ